MMSAVATAKRELLRRYASADEQTRKRGRIWYAEYRREAARIVGETGYRLDQVVAVMAITSVDAQLSQNVRWADEACKNGGKTAGRYPKGQRPKIRRALRASADAGRYATGPKVSAFYAAIMGNSDVLVIDRWASFACGGSRARVPRKAEREVFAEAYRSAAAQVGETVRDFQAIVWIQCRESTPRVNGGTVRYMDITGDRQLRLPI